MSRVISEIRVGRLLVRLSSPVTASDAPLRFQKVLPANALKIVHAFCDQREYGLRYEILRADTSELPQVLALSNHTDKLWVPSPDKALTSRGTGGTTLWPQVIQEE